MTRARVYISNFYFYSLKNKLYEFDYQELYKQ